MTRGTARFFKASGLIIILILIDQATKIFLVDYLRTIPGYNFTLTWFLDIVYAWNYGISFGLFTQYYDYSNYFFLTLSTGITCWLVYILIRSNDTPEFLGVSFIIGGAIGNLIDRIFKGAVFDFILFHYKDLSFPVFNLADSFITIGAILFFTGYLKQKVLAR